MSNLIPTPLWEDAQPTKMKDVVLNLRKIRMRDYELFERKEAITIKDAIELLARISNYTADELWDLELEEFNILRISFLLLYLL
jgi:hypothetical protein